MHYRKFITMILYFLYFYHHFSLLATAVLPRECHVLPGLRVMACTPGLKVMAYTPGLKVMAYTPGLKVTARTPGLRVVVPTPGLKVMAHTPGFKVTLVYKNKNLSREVKVCADQLR